MSKHSFQFSSDLKFIFVHSRFISADKSLRFLFLVDRRTILTSHICSDLIEEAISDDSSHQVFACDLFVFSQFEAQSLWPPSSATRLFSLRFSFQLRLIQMCVRKTRSDRLARSKKGENVNILNIPQTHCRCTHNTAKHAQIFLWVSWFLNFLSRL